MKGGRWVREERKDGRVHWRNRDVNRDRIAEGRVDRERWKGREEVEGRKGR